MSISIVEKPLLRSEYNHKSVGDVAFSPDGKHLLYAADGGMVVDGTQVCEMDGRENPRIKISPNGKRTLFGRHFYKIGDPDGLREWTTARIAEFSEPAFTSDGKHIIAAYLSGGGIKFLIDVETSTPEIDGARPTFVLDSRDMNSFVANLLQTRSTILFKDGEYLRVEFDFEGL